MTFELMMKYIRRFKLELKQHPDFWGLSAMELHREALDSWDAHKHLIHQESDIQTVILNKEVR